ncbi:low affinity immunoglobulin gamma Fc region receptor III-A-like isoform X3 [Trachinotus anak]|uniref:low affinity immunoglobulin gamma Fc region receptor III-A-like isoform X3 n=1 Tax=Trachinotus anak TaxID=443729 RepID=UPI0039F1D70A
MEVRALCIRLVLMLLVAHAQQSYPQTSVSDADVRIVPSRLQLFEYESVSFTCRGFNLSAGWSVRNIKEVIPTCLTSVTCTLNYAFVSDSGEYWCEGAGGERSSTVNITVTGGSVILESPVLPVMEGEAVTLRCRNRATSSNLTADFYKDGLFIGSSSTGKMTIASVSKFDGGLYTCSISGAGESPASRLTVRVVWCCSGGSVILDGPALPVTEGDAVTLRCRNQGTPSELQAEFYKDGLLIRSSSTGEMTIDPVSKSDEGLYKCSVSGVGESAQSPLTVTASREGIVLHHHYSILLWVVIAVVLVLQLLVIGLLHWKKQLVLLEVQLNDPNKDQHSVVKQDKKKRYKEGKEDKKRKGSFI